MILIQKIRWKLKETGHSPQAKDEMHKNQTNTEVTVTMVA
jgi:hypothetical protein